MFVGIFDQWTADEDSGSVGTDDAFTWTEIGARGGFNFNEHWGVSAELGYSMVENTWWNDGISANLTKFTVAGTLSAGTGFWARPQLRAFVSVFAWDHEDAAGGDTAGWQITGNNDPEEDGAMTVGFQAEAWW